MLMISQKELEKRINLDFETIQKLCGKNEMPAPLVYSDGTYEWNMVDIANFIEKNIDQHEITTENKQFWNSYLQHRNTLYKKELMVSIRSRSRKVHNSRLN